MLFKEFETAKMKSERSAPRNFFIICLFIPFVLANAAISLLRKVSYAFVQNGLETFNDNNGDNTPVEQYTAFR